VSENEFWQKSDKIIRQKVLKWF